MFPKWLFLQSILQQSCCFLLCVFKVDFSHGLMTVQAKYLILFHLAQTRQPQLLMQKRPFHYTKAFLSQSHISKLLLQVYVWNCVCHETEGKKENAFKCIKQNWCQREVSPVWKHSKQLQFSYCKWTLPRNCPRMCRPHNKEAFGKYSVWNNCCFYLGVSSLLWSCSDSIVGNIHQLPKVRVSASASMQFFTKFFQFVIFALEAHSGSYAVPPCNFLLWFSSWRRKWLECTKAARCDVSHLKKHLRVIRWQASTALRRAGRSLKMLNVT